MPKLFKKSGTKAAKAMFKMLNHTAQAHFSELPEAPGFQCTHLGTSLFKISDLRKELKSRPGLIAARSAHIGDWRRIFSGAGGGLDFNRWILQENLGSALLYPFTRTESLDGNGDWNYCPAKAWKEGRLQDLDLYSWESGTLKKIDRAESYFCPFLFVAEKENKTSLISFHLNNSPQKLRSEAHFFLKNEARLKHYLKLSLKSALERSNYKRSLQDILSHAVSKNGKVERSSFEKLKGETEALTLNGVLYSNIEELAEAALIPLKAVADSEEFLRHIEKYPEKIPQISHLFSTLLTAHFLRDEEEIVSSEALNEHYHWGARSMAGFPPFHTGYFAGDTNLRTLKRLNENLISADPKLLPIHLKLMPASLFLLAPTWDEGEDRKVIADLITKILKYSPEEIEDQSSKFVHDSMPKLSDLFLSKFKTGQNFQNCSRFLCEQLPEGFEELSFLQICSLVSQFHKNLS